MYQQSVLGKNKKTITIFHLEYIIFRAVKNCCILHGSFIVMDCSPENKQVKSSKIILNSLSFQVRKQFVLIQG